MQGGDDGGEGGGDGGGGAGGCEGGGEGGGAGEIQNFNFSAREGGKIPIIDIIN